MKIIISATIKKLSLFFVYLWIIIRRLRYFTFNKIRQAPRVISWIKSSVKVSDIKEKSIFVWNDSDAVLFLRIYTITVIFAVVFLIIAVRLLIVASGDYTSYNNLNQKAATHRFDIVDRNDNLLAVNLPGASLYAIPRNVIDPELSVKKLLTVIPNLNKKKILADLKSNKSFVWIKRDITPQEHEKIYNLGIPGFGFEREPKRIYIYGNLLSHLVGYVGRDMRGLSGIEKYFDKALTAETENKSISDFDTALRLSIDVRIQNILSEEIEKGIEKFDAKGATGIVVDPNNGEILALVSKPDFNPHHPGEASSSQLFNMATQGVYEMGSSMKSLTMAIGFDTNSIDMHDAYDLSYMKVNGFRLQDTHPLKGWHSVPHIFLKSSNIGVSQIMLEIGKDNLADYLRRLGLLDSIEIELPERSRPLFPPLSRWTDLNLTTMSYGYGLSVSPLHFMQAMVPVVNGGKLYPLTLIKRDEDIPLSGKRVLKEETSIAMRQLMRLVVSKGTGSKAELKGYYVGGKTGTANIAHAGKYDKDRRFSSFFGIIPATKPRYMVYVMYNEPQGIKETYGFAGGGWVAAPTVGAIFSRLAALYGMEKLDENSEEVQELINVEYEIQDEA